MARVQIFEGGNIQRQGTTDARLRPADFSRSGLGEGLEAAGKALGDFADKRDQVEDIKARVEANRLAVEHSELTRQIGNRVKQTLGEGAEAAADSGVADLEKNTTELLGRASPRARLLLESELGQRMVATRDGFFDHAFREKATAFETSSVAAINRAVEDASDEDDEDRALTLLAPIDEKIAARARFFGKGQDWEVEERRKYVSGFYKSRTLKIATSLGENGGAHAAIQYATRNRVRLTDDDYNAIVNAYDDEALKDWAFAKAQGYDPAIIGVIDQSQPADPLAPQPAGEAAARPAAAARADPSTVFNNLIIPNEGTARVLDNNGAYAKFGVNEAFNPGVDTRTLTRAGAEQIFIEKYWKRSGADKLPPQLAAIHADTFYLNEVQARKFLRDSDGDPDRYMELRRGFLAGLHRRNPAKYPDYESRNKRVEKFADRLGDGGAMPKIEVAINTPTESIRDAVFSTPGVGMRAKRAYFEALVDRKSALKNERDERESETSRLLTSEVLKLGDNFTSLTQLPQDLVTNASPATLSTLTNMADSNKKTRPLPPKVEAQIGYLQTFNPTALADPKVIEGLARLGVPPARLNDLAQQGGAALGRRDSAKPEPVNYGSLESLARPAFEAAGYRFWTVETPGEKTKRHERETETVEDANRKLQLVTTLGEAAQAWAASNPGKTADQATMQGWIANALIRTRQGRAIGTLTDAEVTLAIPKGDRAEIARALVRQGLPVTKEAIARAYRRRLILEGARR